MKQAAGLVVYRHRGAQLEVLLVHPSGNYNRHSRWSIPKGLPDEGETIIEAAIREAQEEAGLPPFAAEQLMSLGHIDYTRSKKRVHAFAVAAPDNVTVKPACWEIDRAEFFAIAKARDLLHPDQVQLLDRLQSLLAS